jgi:hypothetical protein
MLALHLGDDAADDAGVRFAPKATLNSITSSAPAKSNIAGLARI